MNTAPSQQHYDNGNTDINSVSFHCSVCGKCCNSAPLMTIAELFHHQQRFVGSLALRRVHKAKVADKLSAGTHSHTLDGNEVQCLNDLAKAQLFTSAQLPSQNFIMMTMALDYESLHKCPALADNNFCQIHTDRKPAVCSMVPFDALYPDSLQNIVLLNRQYRENCIVAGEHAEFPLVFNNKQLLNPEQQAALQQRRNDLQLEKLYWGNAVFAQLQQQFLSHPSELAKIPLETSLLSLPLVPVISLLAQVSENCLTRCIAYLDQQIILLEQKINQAIIRKIAADKPLTQQFRRYQEHYSQLQVQLLQPCVFTPDINLAKAIESYLLS